MMEDWEEIEICEIGEIITGGTPSKKNLAYYSSNDFPFYKPTDLNKGINISNSKDHLSLLGYEKSRKATANSVLVTCIGATIGKTGLIKKEGAFNQQINAITPREAVVSEYVYYQVIGSEFQGEIKNNASSTTLPILNKGKFSKLRFKLPPLPIQRAIVSKIENLFSSLDSGIADLKKAQEQLKIYRQAVLKKAFEGELTKEWREQQTDLPSAEETLDKISIERNKWIDKEIQNGNNEAKRIRSKISKFESSENVVPLPTAWQWTHFILACTFVIDCHNKTAPYEEKGIYLIRTTNIRDGKLNLRAKIKFVSEDTYNHWSKRVFPQPGDIVFTREAPMGEAAIIPPSTKICLGQRTMILRAHDPLLNRKYLLYNILSEVFQQRFRKSAIGTGVKHLRVGDVESLSFPLCSPEEQVRVVKEIESRLSVCDKVGDSIKDSLAKAQALRQSILKKAFNGKLLTASEIERCKQETDYEPASVLLERIRKEKAK